MRSYRQPGPGGTDASDVILIAVIAAVAVVAAGTWLAGQLAALLFHGDWPPVSVGQALPVAWRLPGHLRDPRQAWPASARAELPGAAGFLVAGTVALVTVAAITVVLARNALRHRSQRGHASRAEIQAVLSEKAVIARGPVVRPSTRRKPR